MRLQGRDSGCNYLIVTDEQVFPSAALKENNLVAALPNMVVLTRAKQMALLDLTRVYGAPTRKRAFIHSSASDTSLKRSISNVGRSAKMRPRSSIKMHLNLGRIVVVP